MVGPFPIRDPLVFQKPPQQKQRSRSLFAQRSHHGHARVSSLIKRPEINITQSGALLLDGAIRKRDPNSVMALGGSQLGAVVLWDEWRGLGLG
ncbi:hypothetical protein D5086_020643 [Populus alba]|uniref:Uncharacterized protein n=1 Tax=Populus alba TaxID=43335 RepID=A0ACC4BL00_POPAL